MWMSWAKNTHILKHTQRETDSHSSLKDGDTFWEVYCQVLSHCADVIEWCYTNSGGSDVTRKYHLQDLCFTCNPSLNSHCHTDEGAQNTAKKRKLSFVKWWHTEPCSKGGSYTCYVSLKWCFGF
jgi:hypothetical protein